MDYNIIPFVSMPLSRIRITVGGIVQGVGFRPFVYRCAKENGLVGFIRNTSGNVLIEVQGNGDSLNGFVKSILEKHPPLANVRYFKASEIPVEEDADFVIQDSASSCNKEPITPPDFSVCDDCLKELFDPSNRRHRYPFINCTNCGPRFTIIKGLPYDRLLTAMASFKMCPECHREYNDPLDRRFHAEPNGCRLCGPKVFWANNSDGSVIAEGDDAINLCEDAVKNGQIAAVKGIGGFHLMVDASNDDAIRLLRERKVRHEKPFAVMFPAGKNDMLYHIKAQAFLNADEKTAVLSRERPIVILKRKPHSKLSKLISPGLETVGAFLPYSPLHCLLTEDLKMPLIATSANISDSPIIKDNQEAIYKLNGIADGFLLHNRDIVRRCDDSVTVASKAKTIFFRRSRGYTPYIFKLPSKLNEPVLAVGGNQKATVALGWEDKAVVSQHLGDLTTEEGVQTFEEAIMSLTDFYNIKPLRIACDKHPDYLSTKWALAQNGVKHIQVQHHHAHIAACMMDNNLTNKVLGISWDGSGYGTDGTIWGGEFLIADYKGFERFCTFRKFRLLGGEQAVKEPRRTLLAILYEIYGEDILRSQKIYPVLSNIFTDAELNLFLKMLAKGFNSPFITSAGRVFDAVASLLGICHEASYEGQGAMMLEDITGERANVVYPIPVKDVAAYQMETEKREEVKYVFDWEPMFKAMHEDNSRNIGVKTISQKFHETLAQLILCTAKTVKKERGINDVCLSGGVFQNKVLTERAVNLLQENNFTAYTHNALPPNDGGICIGQLIVGGLAEHPTYT